jgi:uncharacterized protein
MGGRGRPRVATRRSALLACAIAAAVAALPWPACSSGPRRPEAGAAPAPYAPAPRYPDFTRRSLYLPMRDGVRLAVELYLPRGLEPRARIPAIVHQTRYWRARRLRWPAGLLVDEFTAEGLLGQFKRRALEQGYAWVDVDTRGSGASFGTRPWDYSPDEIRDGTEVVDWIVAQPWSNGRVGAAGASYAGGAAELLLLNHHPAVRAVAPVLCAFDEYADVLAPGGVPLRWWIDRYARATALLDRGEMPGDWRVRYWVAGVRPVDADPDGRLLAAAIREHAGNADFRALDRVEFRDDFPFDESGATPARLAAMRRAFRFFEGRFGAGFRARGVDLASPHAYAGALAASGAAVYAVSGWLDGAYANAAAERFLAYPRARSKLLIGPWDHALQEVSPFGPGGSLCFDLAGELLKFFDHYLKGVDTGIEREAPVHYFTLGEERWKAAHTWPPPARRRPLYLAPAGSLSPEPPTEADAADAYRVDPSVGTGRQTRWDALVGRPLERPHPDRAQRDRALLVYTSAPLPAALEVTGHPVVTLHASSSATDGAFFVYLEDVDPRGRVTDVTEGELRAIDRALDAPSANGLPLPRHSDLRAAAQPLVPGRTAELAFALLPVSYRFAAGHAIRIAIAGADRDHFAAIPASPAPLLRIERRAGAASRIDLPVVP